MTKCTEGFGHFQNENVDTLADNRFMKKKQNNLYKFDVKISSENKKRC